LIEPSVRQLIVSVHDVTPYHRERLGRLEVFLEECGLTTDYSMLVVPDFCREWPLRQHPDFCAWVRRRADAGVEIILHGFYHCDEIRHHHLLARWKATAMTAREGEFLGLDREESARRIRAGRSLLEDITGHPVQSFIAPAWLYGRGTRDALHELGVLSAEDQLSVWMPAQRRTLSRTPVISYASRTRGRVASSLAWSRAATVLLKPCRVARLALHPYDVDVPALMAEGGRALRSLREARTLISYADLALRG
jgi:predicted deacetylase